MYPPLKSVNKLASTTPPPPQDNALATALWPVWLFRFDCVFFLEYQSFYGFMEKINWVSNSIALW